MGIEEEKKFLRIIQRCTNCILIAALFITGVSFLLLTGFISDVVRFEEKTNPLSGPPAKISLKENIWQPPDSTKIPDTPEGDLIRYGRELIAHTAVYLGPKGSVKQISNGMNCQNCHLKGGKKPFGNNYAAVASSYPKFRTRSGTAESVEKRVNDCIERSLNGRALERDGREMKAIVAYILWVGKDIPKNEKPLGAGIWDLPLLPRAADPDKGKLVYKLHCEKCHGPNGEGKLADNGLEWMYPPLCGNSSYNVGAGLYRLSRFAGFVKSNMPNGATFEKPELSDEEAWDVAAFINSMPRPSKDLAQDWPDISTKPFDHPFGPYADSFTEQQHKYGPFEIIRKVGKKN
jgi:thiosulfate dehydrogenase